MKPSTRFTLIFSACLAAGTVGAGDFYWRNVFIALLFTGLVVHFWKDEDQSSGMKGARWIMIAFVIALTFMFGLGIKHPGMFHRDMDDSYEYKGRGGE